MTILPVSPHPVPAKDDPDPSRPIPVLLTLRQSPTVAELWPCFAALQRDPATQSAYSDRMPRTPRDALRLATGPHHWRFWVVAADGEPCGLWYTHDAGLDPRPYAWIGTYMLPHARGQCALDAWRLVQRGLAQQGITRLFAACRVTNRAAQHFAVRCGFGRVGTFPLFARFHGLWDDAVLFCLDPRDTVACWHAASRRSGPC